MAKQPHALWSAESVAKGHPTATGWPKVSRRGCSGDQRVGGSNRGFTIIELLIAIGVMGLTIPSLAIALNNLTGINNRARDLSLANILISNKAEQIRSSGFNSLTAGTVDFSGELPAELASPKSASYSVTVPTAGIAEVTLRLSYKDYSRSRTLTYKTIVSELRVGQ